MITDVWLKMRDRGNLNFNLKHLNYWLGIFSDPDKYRIRIYVENFVLPVAYTANYEIIRHSNLLDYPQTKDLFKSIRSSAIAPCWMPAAFALAAPYYYSGNNNEYLLNIDCDDIVSFGNLDYYFDTILKTMKNYNIPTMSYDYILSYNHFEQWRKRMFISNHWTFGINVSKTIEMKKIITNILSNTMNYTKYFPSIFTKTELNLDVLMTGYLLHERPDLKYIAFITKEGFYHRGFPKFETYCTKFVNDVVSWSFSGKSGSAPLYPKTLVL